MAQRLKLKQKFQLSFSKPARARPGQGRGRRPGHIVRQLSKYIVLQLSSELSERYLGVLDTV